MKKMPTTDIQEELTKSDILELTNEENAYSRYYIQEELTNWKKFQDILELTNAARNGPLLFSSLSGCK